MGDSVDIGFGAIVIGHINLADDIVIGAGAVVTKSFVESSITLIGVPAKIMKKG